MTQIGCCFALGPSTHFTHPLCIAAKPTVTAAPAAHPSPDSDSPRSCCANDASVSKHPSCHCPSALCMLYLSRVKFRFKDIGSGDSEGVAALEPSSICEDDEAREKGILVHG